MTEFTFEMPDDVRERLQLESERRNLTIEALVNVALAQFLDDEAIDDPSEEQILADMRESLKEIAAGNYRPAHEVLDEIEQEAVDADKG